MHSVSVSGRQSALGSAPGRRTQKQRRESTRGLLLDAAAVCLAEYGYANTTLALVSERAGFTRGAQLHHFPTKAQLMEAAVEKLSDQAIATFDGRLSGLGQGENPLEAFLDGIWMTLDGPLFAISMEVTVAARTDQGLRTVVVEGLRRLWDIVDQRVVAVAKRLRPDDPKPLEELLHLSVHLVQAFGLDGVLGDRGLRNHALYGAWRERVLTLAYQPKKLG